MSEFVTVGDAEDVPSGEMRPFRAGDHEVAVANVDGTFYAFGDICTHARCHISEGDLEDTTAMCPCHGSEFDVRTGEVLTPPALEPVPTYEVSVEDGELRIGL